MDCYYSSCIVEEEIGTVACSVCILIVCEVVLDHASDMEGCCLRTHSDMFFYSKDCEGSNRSIDRPHSPTLLRAGPAVKSTFLVNTTTSHVHRISAS